MIDPANDEQARFWDDITPSWVAAEQHTELVSEQVGRLAMQRLALAPGMRVLDVGCGTGATTLELAAAVAPDGTAVGVDIAPAMIEVARRRGAERTEVSAAFEAVDAQVADVDGAPFDAVFSRFGVMFFADATAAFTHLRSLMRPGGRLAFTCWQELFSNEFMFVPGAAVISVTGVFPTMPGPGEPGPFSLADPDLITSTLGDAGFADVAVEQVADVVRLPESRVESIVELSRSVGPVHEALRDADDELTERVLDAVREALAGKVEDGELRLSIAANVVTATA